ncbi:MAG TPA: YjbH domain-containing protein [Burkholderiales bacterium]|nr:YjbH domain-containing protein [Burkholderiales bacterium]
MGPFLFLLLLFLAGRVLAQEPSVSGQTGLISMPDARFAPEGTWRSGFSFLRPYEALWSNVTVFPWLEGSFRFTRIYDVQAFPDRPDAADYGDYRDKSFDAKVLLLPERGLWPAIALGAQDAFEGTSIFRAAYGVMSKRLGELDLTLGYGVDRLDGAFGGLRWSPSALPGWSLVAEYDAYDYKQDFGSDLSGAAAYKKEGAIGVEYRSDFWGAKAFASHGEVGFNVYVQLPLEQREFVPKVEEPPPYTRINPRPTEAQWADDPEHRARLARALVEQDFRGVSLGYENSRLEAVLTNVRISSMPRAVGRAARTMLSFAPLEVREIRITYVQGSLPLATYTFINMPLLQRYFNGMASREQLAPYVAIEYAKPLEASEEADKKEALIAFEEPLPVSILTQHPGADIIAVGGENVLGGRLRVRPGLSIYFNDPSGVFKYELYALAAYDRALTRQLFFQAESKLQLIENVSDVTQPSNSTLPHVRTDIAEYKETDFKLTRLLVNRFYHPQERVYVRLSAGIYEEMFGGVGGQALYLPRDGSWSADLAVDWVRQRDFEGWFGFQDYRTVTSIASLHYRMAQGTTLSLRAGRFLAKDEGVRGEIKRRFASGFEVGAWYTITNGNDITSPGSPSDPYYDKGVFVIMPLETMRTRDTQSVAGIALAPWTRDVGQMVVSPGDLARIVERPVIQMHTRDGLVRFGDRDDDYHLPMLGADRQWPDFLAADLFGTARSASEIDWFKSTLAAVGGTLGSATLDDRAFEYADEHRNKSWMKNFVDFGDALPFAAVGVSALFAFDESRPRLSDAGVAALEAGGLALIASTGLKYAVGRARPPTGMGKSEFEPFTSEDAFHSFPSRHTTVTWAAITPYAKEFDMPWLYGVAALTNLSRTGSREHWLSDTVAGSFLGYALGHLAWEGRREARRGKNVPAVAVGPGSVTFAWDLE